MEPVAYMYGLPYKYYEQYKIRRYGFHGSSHRYVSQEAAKMMNKPLDNCKTIVCHIGNGSSVTAVVNGKSVDTSMGFTPVEGVTMGTRCGNIDAGAVIFLQEKEGLDAKGIGNVLNKKSGLLGVSGISSDNRDIEEGMRQGNARAKLARRTLTYGIKKYIGAYAAAMNGVDLIVFTGGIGENSATLREEVCTDMEYLGVDFDKETNLANRGNDVIISKPGSRVKVVAVTTNEELVIARDTMALTK